MFIDLRGREKEKKNTLVLRDIEQLCKPIHQFVHPQILSVSSVVGSVFGSEHSVVTKANTVLNPTHLTSGRRHRDSTQQQNKMGG